MPGEVRRSSRIKNAPAVKAVQLLNAAKAALEVDRGLTAVQQPAVRAIMTIAAADGRSLGQSTDMPEHVRMKLKAGGAIVGLIGLLTGLANLMGFFSNPERQQLVASIRSAGEASSGAHGFSDLVQAFPPPPGVRLSQIAGIGPTTHISSGGYVTPTGPLAYFDASAPRRYTAPILTFDELQSWAQTSRYPWVAWAISLLGWLLVAVGVAADFAKQPARAPEPG